MAGVESQPEVKELLGGSRGCLGWVAKGALSSAAGGSSNQKRLTTVIY